MIQSKSQNKTMAADFSKPKLPSNVFEILNHSLFSTALQKVMEMLCLEEKDHSKAKEELQNIIEGIFEDVNKIKMSCFSFSEIIDKLNKKVSFQETSEDLKAKKYMKYLILKIKSHATQIQLQRKKLMDKFSGAANFSPDSMQLDILKENSNVNGKLSFNLKELKYKNYEKYKEIYELIKRILTNNKAILEEGRKPKEIQESDSELVKLLKSLLSIIQEIQKNKIKVRSNSKKVRKEIFENKELNKNISAFTSKIEGKNVLDSQMLDSLIHEEHRNNPKKDQKASKKKPFKKIKKKFQLFKSHSIAVGLNVETRTIKLEKELNRIKAKFNVINRSVVILKRRIEFYEHISRPTQQDYSNTSAPDGKNVSIIFTDIQGSTQLWNYNVELMEKSLTLHNSICRKLIKQFGLYETKTEGDAFMICSKSPENALMFALSLQKELMNGNWPQEMYNHHHCKIQEAYPPDVFGTLKRKKEIHKDVQNCIFKGIRVRIGIHIGNCITKIDETSKRADYFGPTINFSARVSSFADGGQIIISDDFYKTLKSKGFKGIGKNDSELFVVDLGLQKFKGFEKKSKVFSVVPFALQERMKFFKNINPNNIKNMESIKPQKEVLVNSKNKFDDTVKRYKPNEEINVPIVTLEKLKNELTNLHKEKKILFSQYSKICQELPTMIEEMKNKSGQFLNHLSSIKRDISYLHNTEETLPVSKKENIYNKNNVFNRIAANNILERVKKTKLRKNRSFRVVQKTKNKKEKQEDLELALEKQRNSQALKNFKLSTTKNIKLQERVKELEKQLDDQISKNEELMNKLSKKKSDRHSISNFSSEVLQIRGIKNKKKKKRKEKQEKAHLKRRMSFAVPTLPRLKNIRMARNSIM